MTKPDNYSADDWATIDVYIESLLKDGKRSQHPEFQLLFAIFGKDRITKIAKAILEKEKHADTLESKK